MERGREGCWGNKHAHWHWVSIPVSEAGFYNGGVDKLEVNEPVLVNINKQIL
ncbi:hypothetical protein DPMN_127840 [Dreissena polymorpha]|uniref:Uncharacterized protein n=1 Tax=Dreissena polymorpha TaxID=45954 RepID=A0A9D4GZQ8_DREPO|nr:hypothetical protein DPMN_127840 [Dreissena polymorpha]